MADVFISYVNEDRPRAEALARAIAGCGFTVWWDRNLHGGADFAAEIERELAAARAVIVLWSAKSRESQWVRDEAAYARDAGKLVPARLDDAPAPLGFRQLQAIDLSRWNGAGAGPAFEPLLDSVRHFASPAGPPSPPVVMPPSPSRARLSRLVVVGAFAAVAVAVAFALLWRPPGDPLPAVRASPLLGDVPIDWTVLVQPFTASADGSRDDVATMAFNDLVRALATTDVVALRPAANGPAEGAPLRLEGSVQRTTDGASLSLQLLESPSGRVVWTDSFVLPRNATTFERALQAANQIRAATLAEGMGRGLVTNSVIARQEYVAAIRELHRLWFTTGGNWLVAIRHAENALKQDPGLADAHFWLAVFYNNRLGYTLRAEEALPLAQRHVLELVRTSSDSSPAAWSSAQVKFSLELDYAAAIDALERARQAGSPDAAVDMQIGQILLAQGRLEESIAFLQSSVARSSVDDLPAMRSLAQALSLAGRHDEARRLIENALVMTDDGSFHGLGVLIEVVRICHAQGDVAAANDALDRAWRAHGGERPEWFPGVLALLGRTEEARRILDGAEQRFAAHPLAYSSGAFEGAFLLDDIDSAFVWLDRAIDNREWPLFSRLRLSPTLAPLRADARFAAAMQKLEVIEKHGNE